MKYEFDNNLGVDYTTYQRFFDELETSYLPNPYHNSRHAGDVTHTLLYFINNSELSNYMTVLEMLATIVAASCHDVGHLGLTNRFLVKNNHKLALRYNDISVLENMH
jgi:hypothetical protein